MQRRVSQFVEKGLKVACLQLQVEIEVWKRVVVREYVWLHNPTGVQDGLLLPRDCWHNLIFLNLEETIIQYTRLDSNDVSIERENE